MNGRMNDRVNTLRWADAILDDARDIARRHTGHDGTLSNGMESFYLARLVSAASGYRSAGLTLLSNRVYHFARRVALYGTSENVRDAWNAFDRLNAGGRCPA